jgi:hypothetical protein
VEADFFGLDLISKDELEMLHLVSNEDENVLNKVATGAKTPELSQLQVSMVLQ